ncbi:alpha/beta hydrolase [Streptosporangium fragile]|uniref:alpha/beta fold hydrolase n=1 Tax=Streptosporangium fragile TaxID=46186 RepID=UPI0031F18F38
MRGRTLFVRQDGPAEGPPVTLVHGFPTSSHDWAGVVPLLAEAGLRVTTFDLLGFGHSDKPRGHAFSIEEQADLAQGVWERLGIAETALVAHDYGVSVAQELLARDQARIARMAWMNGGLYPDLHRPLLIQKLLHGRLGPLLARVTTQARLTSSMRKILGRPVPDAVLADMWASVAHDNGQLLAPRLLKYIDDRRRNASRWTASLEGYPGPTLFVWGPADPISGAHVLERIRERLPEAAIEELPGVGHYPQVEAPAETGRALAGFLR